MRPFDLSLLVPKRYRPAAKAVIAFVLPLVSQIVVLVSEQGLSVGNAIRTVVVSALISYATYETTNRK